MNRSKIVVLAMVLTVIFFILLFYNPYARWKKLLRLGEVPCWASNQKETCMEQCGKEYSSTEFPKEPVRRLKHALKPYFCCQEGIGYIVDETIICSRHRI